MSQAQPPANPQATPPGARETPDVVGEDSVPKDAGTDDSWQMEPLMQDGGPGEQTDSEAKKAGPEPHQERLPVDPSGRPRNA